jgi:hypothetical protein
MSELVESARYCRQVFKVPEMVYGNMSCKNIELCHVKILLRV